MIDSAIVSHNLLCLVGLTSDLTQVAVNKLTRKERSVAFMR